MANPFEANEQVDPQLPLRPFLGPCWMDDLAIPVAGSSAEEAVRKVGILAGLLLDQCVNFAMSPNLAAGKTEILLALRGRKSRQLRQQFYGAHGRRLFPIVGEHGSYQIQVVTRYKHLGGVIHHGGDQRQEAKQRLAVAHQTFTQQRKVLYCNPSLDLKTRTQMFESIVCSAFTYGSESWCFGTIADRHHIHVGIIKLYKRLIKWVPHKHNGWNDDEICDFLGLPTPTELLRRSRLGVVKLHRRSFAVLQAAGRLAQAAQHGDRRHDGALPPQQTQGASLEPVRPRDIRVESTDLILKLVDALADREPDACLAQTLRATIQTMPISWTQCSATLAVFLESVDDDFAGMLGLEPSVLRKAVETLQRVEAWDFLEAPALGHSGPDDELAHFDRNQEGAFKTTQLKEYPPALCAALAQCTVKAMRSIDTAEQISVDTQFLQQCHQMVSRDFGAYIGPDHVR
ncbi:unnamed protein product [Cladocopium goreaui]|uniref:Copia protein n=1 Tax=Cladocopium goreaui TaxID=2562237 RepID=A0A9P1DCC7_9DINO|nr:unnamed protein product [Cladocopium goreaui]